MVLEVRAVFALVVVRASAVVVRGQVEAGRSVLTGVGGAIIDVQLGRTTGRRGGEMMLDFLSAAVNRAKPRSILPAGWARKQPARGEREGGKAESSQSGLLHGGMYTAVARSSFNKALPLEKNGKTVEQQSFKKGGAGKFYNEANDTPALAEGGGGGGLGRAPDTRVYCDRLTWHRFPEKPARQRH